LLLLWLLLRRRLLRGDGSNPDRCGGDTRDAAETV